MNNFKINLVRFVIYITLFCVIFACQKDEPAKEPERLYLENFEKKASYTAADIRTALSLISLQYPELSEFAEHITHDIDVFVVSYKTTFKDKEISASGVICIPDTEEEFSITSFQNGTNVLHANAPSKSINDPLSFLRIVQYMAATGNIVVMPDYIGFGESEDILHPYHHKKSSNRSVIDLILASLELLEDNTIKATSNEELYLMGYSQGGWATLSAFNEIEQLNPFTSLNVSAVSCGAGAFNLLEVTDHILGLETYSNPYYLAYLIESHRSNDFLNNSLEDFFKQPYANRIPELFDGITTAGNINSELNDTVSSLFVNEMLNDFENEQFTNIRAMLTENSVSAFNVEIPIRFYHGTADEDIPLSSSSGMVNDLKQINGTLADSINFYSFEGLGHGEAIIPWGTETFKWFLQIQN